MTLPRTVQAYCKRGKLRAVKVTGRHWLIPEDVLREFVTPAETQNAAPRRRRAPEKLEHLRLD